MRAIRLAEVTALLGGRRIGGDPLLRSVVTDSRQASPGALFFALRGSRADGHAHVRDALDRGAAAAVVRSAEAVPGPLLVVPDPLRALWELARAEREALGATVIGITGSTGKTTTKDMTAAILRLRHRVHASPGSYNNQVGLPLTILGGPSEIEVLVCELGAGVVGEIADLCALARPEIGVVTSVGMAHLETFGSRENIVRAKREIVEALPASGLAVLNADDRAARGYSAATRATVLTFGRTWGADVRATCIRLDPLARARFRLVTGNGAEEVVLAVPGEHMVTCALGAAAVGLALGLTPAGCAAGLHDVRLSPGRMEVFRAARGALVVNDAYNANPSSMRAGLRTARRMAASGRLVAVLGPMAELGPSDHREHLAIGRLAARLRVDRVVVVAAPGIAEGARRAGLRAGRVTECADGEDALLSLEPIIRAGDVIFIKGSHVAGLERIADALRSKPGAVGRFRSSSPGPDRPSSSRCS